MFDGNLTLAVCIAQQHLAHRTLPHHVAPDDRALGPVNLHSRAGVLDGERIVQLHQYIVGKAQDRHHTVLELTHNWDTERYDLGSGFGHVALGVEDIYATCDSLRRKGAKIVREPGPMKHGGSEIAFIEDPDGYKIELIQLRGRSD